MTFSLCSYSNHFFIYRNSHGHDFVSFAVSIHPYQLIRPGQQPTASSQPRCWCAAVCWEYFDFYPAFCLCNEISFIWISAEAIPSGHGNKWRGQGKRRGMYVYACYHDFNVLVQGICLVLLDIWSALVDSVMIMSVENHRRPLVNIMIWIVSWAWKVLWWWWLCDGEACGTMMYIYNAPDPYARIWLVLFKYDLNCMHSKLFLS